jgi:ubiquitin C-terminal hydrolase
MNNTGGRFEDYQITTLLNNAMNHLNMGEVRSAVSNITEIRRKLSKFHPNFPLFLTFLDNGQFANTDQQDAQEFLTCLIQKISSEMDYITGSRPYLKTRDIETDQNLEGEYQEWLKAQK